MDSRPRRKQCRPIRFSPTPTSRPSSSSKPRRKSGMSNDDAVAGDLLADGSLFLCEKCGSTFLDSKGRGVRRKCKVVHPTLRYDTHGKELLYCKACGMEHDQKTNPSTNDGQAKKPQERDEEDAELVEFSLTLPAFTGLANADKLVCSNTSKGCQCLQRYLKNSGEVTTEAKALMDIINEAEQLKSLKVNNLPAGTRNRDIGLGNGKKRSKLYENFVLHQRPRLREELCLCEPTAQKLLGYSNNFLHKSLLTEENRTRLGGKKRSSLHPITMLWKHECCRDSCTRMVRSHLNLIAKWRQLSVESRRGLQQAVAELLTPTAGAKTNCYKFISLVTGCSTATIAKVVSKMRKNGGVLGMHEHGLRKYWRRKREVDPGDEQSDEELPSVWTLPEHHAEEVQLRQTVEKQRKELEQLKSQLSEQQKKIDEQKSQLSSLNRKPSTSGGLKSPSLMLRSPPTGNWRSDNRLTIDIASEPSPQYPRRQSTSRPLLQPSKLDNAVKQHQEFGLQSNSTVVATPKHSYIAQVPQEPQQPVLQAMQYYYSNNPDMATNMFKQDSMYLGHQISSVEHMHNISSSMAYPQELFTPIQSLPHMAENSHPQYHNQLPSAPPHPHSQLHYL